jgi:hypothetical protein|nr:MAG TPA: hypothetical protein [Caudoviricetes sp.]
MLEKLAIAGMIILVGAYFVALFIDLKDYEERREKEKQEAIELRIKNVRLEEQLKVQEEKKAEQTKKTDGLNK